MVDIKRAVALVEKVLGNAKRHLELKGAPMVIFQTDTESVWILEDGSIVVGTWKNEEWIIADDEISLEILRLALFEFALKANYDELVRGKKDDD